MTEVKKMATREGYGEALLELADAYPNLVVLDADLSGSTKTALFAKAHPDRFVNCGIAEANMAGIAAGLAASGKIAVMSSFAMFASGRNFEQIRNSIAYPNLNVKIGATHAGITVGEDGATHQANEDIAIMRAIPGMTVVNPSDYIEAKACLRACIEHPGPVYMRFGRQAVPVINDREDYKFELGKGQVLVEGSDISIIATGVCVDSALGAQKLLEADGIHAEVINIHTIKPIDTELLVKTAQKTGRIFTVEEHSVIGGLGSAVLDALAENCPTKTTKLGVQDVFGVSAAATVLLEKYRLDAKGVYEQIKEKLT